MLQQRRSRERYKHTPAHHFRVGELGFSALGRVDPQLQMVAVLDEAGRAPEAPGAATRGVVYYIDDDRIVGVLLCNVSTQSDAARRILRRRKLYYDKTLLKQLMSIEDAPQPVVPEQQQQQK